MFGGRLVNISQPTLELLTNPEVLEVNQRSQKNRQVRFLKQIGVWAAEHQDSNVTFVAVSNLNHATEKVDFTFKEVGRETKTCQVRDLWERKELGQFIDHVTSGRNQNYFFSLFKTCN
jgi:hypothetical protein